MEILQLKSKIAKCYFVDPKVDMERQNIEGEKQSWRADIT